MESQRPGHSFAAFLVEKRHVLFAVMLALAVVFALMIPRTRINEDVTTNLPADSQMRKGLQIMEEEFPMMDIRMQTLRVMFWNEAPADSLLKAIEAIPGVARWMGTEQRDSCTLYQFSLPRDAKGPQIIAAVKARFGDRVLAEVDDNSRMPDNLMSLLVTGVAIALLILILMCPSFMESVVFLIAIGIAVALNMGTNALLPNVYMMTHMLAAVLQMVLSMDFGIILLNRFRQEKRPARTNEEAMRVAIAGAAPSILGSGMTTIASLMMLCFMRLHVGMDLGVVLSKGVLFSLIATFTALPALILRFDRAIVRTEKPMLRLPTDPLARFEMRYRIPLAILFVAIFFGSWFLQQQTRISYSVEWPSPITDIFPPKNPMVIIYRTDDEEAFLPIADRIMQEPGVLACLSYPSIALKSRTASEWGELAQLMPGTVDSIPDGAIDLLYYATTHPGRQERMRLDQLEPTARELMTLAEQYLPEGATAGLSTRFDIDRQMKQMSASLLKEPKPEPIQEAAPAPAPDTVAVQLAVDTLAVEAPVADTLVVQPAVLDTLRVEKAGKTEADSAFGEIVSLDLNDTDALRSYFTYESITQPRTVEEMSSFLTIDKRYVSMVYRIARAGRKGRPSKMSAYEFLKVLTGTVLTNKLYASMVSADQKKVLYQIEEEFDDVYAAGPTLLADAVPALPDVADTLAIQPAVEPAPAVDSSLIAQVEPENPLQAVPEPEIEPEPEPEPTPLERLAEMAFSGRSYTSAQLYRALHEAGVGVSREELDLLYLYYGYKTQRDTTTRLNLLELVEGVSNLAQHPLLAQYLDTTARSRLDGLQAMLDQELGALRSGDWSLAAVVSELPPESDETFAFIDRVQTMCREQLSVEPYFAGFTVMYKETKEGFPRELLVLTLLTVGTIFLIVALTFRSLAVPFLLIPTVLSAVWLNVYASGLGGHTLLYLAYLIVQSILMGATIDYSILFTQYYRDARRTVGRGESLKQAYRKSFHAILTSGLILMLTPALMSYTITDPTIIAVLRSISAGALAAILLIFFVLPATIAICDRWVVKR